MRRFVAVFGMLCCLLGWLVMPVQAASVPGGGQGRHVWEHSQRVNGNYPDWQSDVPFCLNELRLLMTPEELNEVLGEAGRAVDEGFNVYSDNVVVRLRDGLAVNISVSGELGSWTLQREHKIYATVGDAKNQIVQKLGKPFARYTRQDKPWEILLYAAKTADIGLFMINDQVHGFMLTEPGMLGSSLQYQGFKCEPTI